MPSLPTRVLRDLTIGVVGVTLGLAVAAATRGGGHRSAAASVRRLDLPAASVTAAPPADVQPAHVAAGSAAAAVRQFLQAKARSDSAVSYGLLDRASRARYPTLAAWTAVQADGPPVATVRVGTGHPGPAGAVDVTVELTHPAGVDPFIGLIPGRTVEVWRARREAGQWRVDAVPVSVRALLPSDRQAPAAVQAWVGRLLACDAGGATALQAAATLYGPANLPAAPCRERGRWTVAGAQGFDTAPDPQPYVAAFGPDVLGWARVVAVQGPRTRFLAVVAPIGDAWRVLGTDPADAGR